MGFGNGYIEGAVRSGQQVAHLVGEKLLLQLLRKSRFLRNNNNYRCKATRSRYKTRYQLIQFSGLQEGIGKDLLYITVMV